MTMNTYPALELEKTVWRDPVAVVRAVEHLDFAFCLLSGGDDDERWSYVGAEPDHIQVAAGGEGVDLSVLPLPGAVEAAAEPDAPPITGGWLGLVTYDAGADEAVGVREVEWPDLILARYPGMLAFDHSSKTVWIIGRGATMAAAAEASDRAASWLSMADAATEPQTVSGALADHFQEEEGPDVYRASVADVVRRIGEGEIFQANIARAWNGRLIEGTGPSEVFERLARLSPSDYAAYWRLADGALVSNSPEQFLKLVTDGRVEARPIKGTRPRGATTPEDVRLALELVVSQKDRAENLMIVDLMRNDLSQVCAPGSVEVEAMCELMSLPRVHHLVSTVSGRTAEGSGAGDLLAAAFPPGSITGAPKHQAMKVIAEHEPPRGPWCGTLTMVGFDGAMTASVLIRTLAFRQVEDRWLFRTQAGAGIVADSNPEAELAETDAKISMIRSVLDGSAA